MAAYLVFVLDLFAFVGGVPRIGEGRGLCCFGRSGDFFQKFRGVREKQEVFLGGFFIRRSLVSPLDCSWRRLGALIISLKQSVTPWLGVGDCFGKLVRPQPTLFARFFSLPLCLDGYMTVVSGNTVFGPTHSDR